jgi:surface protein
MFQFNGYLENFDPTNFDTSSSTDMSYMFQSCSKIKELDLSKYDTSKVTNMYYMFGGCENLEKLEIFNFKKELLICVICSMDAKN